MNVSHAIDVLDRSVPYFMIKRIEGLKGLNSLKSLELNNNLLFRLEAGPYTSPIFRST